MIDEKDYIQGFNAGYILQQYRPELVPEISKTVEPATGYVEGFLNGKEEYEIERAQNELDAIRHRSKDQEREM